MWSRLSKTRKWLHQSWVTQWDQGCQISSIKSIFIKRTKKSYDNGFSRPVGWTLKMKRKTSAMSAFKCSNHLQNVWKASTESSTIIKEKVAMMRVTKAQKLLNSPRLQICAVVLGARRPIFKFPPSLKGLVAAPGMKAECSRSLWAM